MKDKKLERIREDFQTWFDVKYPVNAFESDADRKVARKIAYSSWVASITRMKSQINELITNLEDLF